VNAGNGSGTGGASGGSGMGAPDLALPIEVLGSGSPDEPVIRSTRLLVAAEDVAAVQTLFVTCHRCGFYNAPEFEALSKPLTKVKASLRVVGGASGGADAAWVDITDANVQVDAVSAAHGGINGALVTIGFTLTLDAATRARLVGGAAGNQVEFRFNGTDGSSNSTMAPLLYLRTHFALTMVLFLVLVVSALVGTLGNLLVRSNQYSRKWPIQAEHFELRNSICRTRWCLMTY